MAKQLILALILGTCVGACGQSGPDPTDPTPTPTPTTACSGTSCGTAYNLESYAKITASSFRQVTDGGTLYERGPDHVADGMIGDASRVDGYIWTPNTAHITNAWIKFEWNSQVNLREIQIHDSPVLNQQILSGEVSFANSVDRDLSFSDLDFGQLPDNGGTPARLTGPSSPITSMTITIRTFKGDLPGIAEVYVMGSRVDEEIAEADAVPFSKVTMSPSAYKSTYPDTDTGPYRSAMMKDADNLTSWISPASGFNKSVTIEFDRPYLISSVVLHDRHEFDCSGLGCSTTVEQQRFTKASVHFEDADVTKSVTKAVADDSATITLTPPIESQELWITFDEARYPSGEYLGFSKIEVHGEYTP